MAKIIDMQAARRRLNVAAAAKVAARLRAVAAAHDDADEADAYAAFIERVRADKPELAAILESVPPAYFGVECSVF
jgi:hypothetical protein